MREFYASWQSRLDEIDATSLDVDGAIDHVLLRNELRYRIARLDREAAELAAMAELLPFAGEIAALEEARRGGAPVDPAEAARMVARLADAVEERRKAVDAAAGSGASRSVALRAAEATGALGEALENWYEFHAGYDPLFTWWVAEPHARASEALEAYRADLRQKVVGLAPEGEDGDERRAEDPVVGDPIGATGLAADIEHEMLAYDAEGLIAIA
jgi:hypothetical protein